MWASYYTLIDKDIYSNGNIKHPVLTLIIANGLGIQSIHSLYGLHTPDI